jgi:hypothetical protein
MKSVIAIVMLASVLGFAQEATAPVWKGGFPRGVVWDHDPRLPSQTEFQYDTQLQFLLDDGDSITVYYHRFHSGSPDQYAFALSMYNTAKDALMNGKHLWLQFQEEHGITAVAVGPLDPSILPVAMENRDRREIRTGSAPSARFLFAEGRGPRDVLGRMRPLEASDQR